MNFKSKISIENYNILKINDEFNFDDGKGPQKIMGFKPMEGARVWISTSIGDAIFIQKDGFYKTEFLLMDKEIFEAYRKLNYLSNKLHSLVEVFDSSTSELKEIKEKYDTLGSKLSTSLKFYDDTRSYLNEAYLISKQIRIDFHTISNRGH